MWLFGGHVWVMDIHVPWGFLMRVILDPGPTGRYIAAMTITTTIRRVNRRRASLARVGDR
jgi:hypothetical protein